MTADDLPKWMLPKALAGGKVGYYWSPPRKLPEGCPLERRALGTNFTEAKRKAEAYNEAYTHWLIHKTLPGEPGRPVILPGSIDDVFATYKAHAPSKPRSFAKLKPGQKKDYERFMRRFADHVLKDGRRAGEVMARDCSPAFIDAMYEKLLYDKDGNARRRVTNHVMAACRRAWNVAHRAKPDKVPAVNPFDKLGLDNSAAETQAATLDQLITFTGKATELGYHDVAFAARAAWDLLIRVSEIRQSFSWTHWRPLDRPDHVFVGSDKNKNPIWKRLGEWVTDEATGKAVWMPFYPELEALLAAVPKLSTLVCARRVLRGREKARDDRPAIYRGYPKKLFEARAAEVRKAAGLPDHVTLTSFRHGGLTELGDAGLPDSWAQVQSRHKQRSMLDRYIKRTGAQETAGARLRIAHRRGQAG